VVQAHLKSLFCWNTFHKDRDCIPVTFSCDYKFRPPFMHHTPRWTLPSGPGASCRFQTHRLCWERSDLTTKTTKTAVHQIRNKRRNSKPRHTRTDRERKQKVTVCTVCVVSPQLREAPIISKQTPLESLKPQKRVFSRSPQTGHNKKFSTTK